MRDAQPGRGERDRSRLHRRGREAARKPITGARTARREELRALHRALRGQVDGFITLGHIGPGQLGQPQVGTPWYNDASSAIGAPTFGLPLLAVDGLPLGIQLMGWVDEDEELARIARWFVERTPRALSKVRRRAC